MQSIKTLHKIANRQQRIIQYASKCKYRTSTKDVGTEVHTWGKTLHDLKAAENGVKIGKKLNQGSR